MKTRSWENSWITCPKARPQAQIRLFCFPYSGAGASIFYAWPAGIPSSIEVCPVQLPGRESRLGECPFTRLEPLIRALSEVLPPAIDRPFAFFGHSLGALVGFELARELRQRHDLSPVHLFVSSHCAPQTPDMEPSIHDLPEADFIERLRHLNGMSQHVLSNKELMSLLTPILRADFAVCETYTYGDDEPLDCPISAYGGLEDEHVTRADLEAWRHQTRASFSLRLFPGDHFYLNTERSLLLRTLARELSDYG